MKQKRMSLKKVLVGLLLLLLMMSLAGCAEVEPAISYIEVTVDEEIFEDKFHYGLLEEEDQLVYRELYQGLINHQEEICVHGSNWKKQYLILDYVLYDFPALFWVDGSADSTLYGQAHTVVEPTYVYTMEERTQREAEIEAEVTTILNQIPVEWTEYEKIKFVFEYLVNSVEYVEEAPDNQNIYSALVNKQTVCAGYARANQYLLNEMGIFCTYVTGTTSETEEGGDGHAWNIVKVGENYYIVDVTWSDPVPAEDEEVTEADTIEDALGYEYLCCSQEMVADTHFEDEEIPYPECTANDLDYYHLNGLYYEALDKATMLQTMKDDIAERAAYTEFKFANAELLNAAIENIRGDWMQDITNYYCDLLGVNEMTCYTQVYDEFNRITIYWVYE